MVISNTWWSGSLWNVTQIRSQEFLMMVKKCSINISICLNIFNKHFNISKSSCSINTSKILPSSPSQSESSSSRFCWLMYILLITNRLLLTSSAVSIGSISLKGSKLSSKPFSNASWIPLFFQPLKHMSLPMDDVMWLLLLIYLKLTIK